VVVTSRPEPFVVTGAAADLLVDRASRLADVLVTTGAPGHHDAEITYWFARNPGLTLVVITSRCPIVEIGRRDGARATLLLDQPLPLSSPSLVRLAEILYGQWIRTAPQAGQLLP